MSRFVLGGGMLAFSALQLRALVRSQRGFRAHRREYDEISRVNDLPDEEFVAWVQENPDGMEAYMERWKASR